MRTWSADASADLPLLAKSKRKIWLPISPSESAAATTLKSQGVSEMAQVKAGKVAEANGEALVSSVSPPTALSLTWGLSDFVTALSKVAA